MRILGSRTANCTQLGYLAFGQNAAAKQMSGDAIAIVSDPLFGIIAKSSGCRRPQAPADAASNRMETKFAQLKQVDRLAVAFLLAQCRRRDAARE